MVETDGFVRVRIGYASSELYGKILDLRSSHVQVVYCNLPVLTTVGMLTRRFNSSKPLACDSHFTIPGPFRLEDMEAMLCASFPNISEGDRLVCDWKYCLSRETGDNRYAPEEIMSGIRALGGHVLPSSVTSEEDQSFRDDLRFKARLDDWLR